MRINNKLNPHYSEAESRNRARATSVGGKFSHQCAIPAPLLSPFVLKMGVDFSLTKCHNFKLG